MDLKELESGVEPSTHWYYQVKKIPLLRAANRLLRAGTQTLNIYDVGAGSGFFTQELQRQIQRTGPELLLIDTGYTPEEVRASVTERVKKTTELPATMQQGLVLLMDVLEHVPDDGAMLKAIGDRAGEELHFFITVPAHPQLWSFHDDYLEHYRRYTQQSLRAVLEDSGYRCESVYYIFVGILPLAWIMRKLLDKNHSPHSSMKPVSPWLNKLLRLYCSIEIPFRKGNRLCGLTVVAEGVIPAHK
ncbi:MAG: methyltransferase domain-containing protein [Verrucomicrobiota bacterium]|nr:methyltransferase domain-containing protein [Verrucomicrobiota bacterium]